MSAVILQKQENLMAVVEEKIVNGCGNLTEEINFMAVLQAKMLVTPVKPRKRARNARKTSHRQAFSEDKVQNLSKTPGSLAARES